MGSSGYRRTFDATRGTTRESKHLHGGGRHHLCELDGPYLGLARGLLVGAVRAVVHLVAVGYTLAYIFTVG